MSPSLIASGETACHIKWLSRLEYVVACPRQLVSQRLDGDHAVCFCFLLLEEALGAVLKSVVTLYG